jgi:hypothetical protein
MSALTVLIIRHAEKPDDAEQGQGITELGEHDRHSLTVRGWQRAGAWAALFGSATFGAAYPRPDAVYAASPDKTDTGDMVATRRALQTVLPLCRRLHIEPIRRFGVTDEKHLVAEIKQLTGVVLVCWEHKKITADILPGFLGAQALPHMPAKWDAARYDVVVRLDRAQAGAAWSLRQHFPMLLAGDSDVPLKDRD